MVVADHDGPAALTAAELARAERGRGDAAAHRSTMGAHRPGRPAPSPPPPPRAPARPRHRRRRHADAPRRRRRGGCRRRPPRRRGRRHCSTGCLTSTSSRRPRIRRSPVSSAPISAAGSPGCASSTASVSVAASPTTWASARRPPRSPTCSPDPDRTSWCARSPSSTTGGPRRRASRRRCGWSSTTAPSAAADGELDGAELVDHHLRPAAEGPRAPRRRLVVDGRGRRGADDQEPGDPRRQGPAGARRRTEAGAHRDPGREPPRRPVGDPRRRQPRSARQPRALPPPLRQAHRARRRRRGGGPACGASPSRSSCVAARPTARWCPTSPTRSSRSPGPG